MCNKLNISKAPKYYINRSIPSSRKKERKRRGKEEKEREREGSEKKERRGSKR